MSDAQNTDAAPRPEDEEYPDAVWPRLYAVVLGFLVFNIVVFVILTRWFQ